MSYTRSQQWRSEDVRGPWTTDSPGPLPILHNLIPLTPLPHTPLLRLCTISLHDFIRHFLIITYLMVCFGNFGPFHDAMGEMGVPWWRNDKWDPLITWWNIIEVTNYGAPWWRNDELGPLITWWEIRGHYFDDMMRKWGGGPWWRNGKFRALFPVGS